VLELVPFLDALEAENCAPNGPGRVVCYGKFVHENAGSS
jgi:hypothetical protein